MVKNKLIKRGEMNIPLSSVNLSRLENKYVRDALSSGWISGTGNYVTRFEEALCQKLGRNYAIATANGTIALELVIRALDIGRGDEVLVPALTFVAPAAVVRTVGSTPVFVDITNTSWTIDPQDVQNKITSRTKAIIAVDLLGHPADYQTLNSFGLPIIEDAAEAHGAHYLGKPVGTFGIASIFSFHANKTITTGEGGCVLTDDASLMKEMQLIANHGMTKEQPYWHEIIGHNFRMTNIVAAIGLGQVERWDELIEARNAVAALYDKNLLGLLMQRRPVATWAKEACWLYTICVNQRDKVLSSLRAEDIDARAIWYALPDLPLYRESCKGEYPISKEVSDHAMWLPTWAFMPPKIIMKVSSSLESAIKKNLI